MRSHVLTREAASAPPVLPKSQMSAATLVGPGQTRIDRLPLPAPAAREVLIRLEGCGVCASNLPPWQGRPWFQYPLKPGELGHEGWGVVESIGSEVGTLREGDRVATLSDRSYAQYTVAPAESCVRLSVLPADEPFPGEPLGCAWNIFQRSDVRDSHLVAIIGIGFLGAVLTQLATAAGARVIALSRRPTALEFARRFGAIHTIEMDDHQRILGEVHRVSDGAGCDRVIEATGKQWPLDLAGELTRERGRLIVAGYHQDGLRQVNMQLWNWRGIDVINAHERDRATYVEGIRRAADAAAGGLINPAPLYTHWFSLQELPEAFRMVQDRPAGFMKALIRM